MQVFQHLFIIMVNQSNALIASLKLFSLIVFNAAIILSDYKGQKQSLGNQILCWITEYRGIRLQRSFSIQKCWKMTFWLD